MYRHAYIYIYTCGCIYNTPAARKAGHPTQNKNALPRSAPQSQTLPPSWKGGPLPNGEYTYTWKLYQDKTPSFGANT